MVILLEKKLNLASFKNWKTTPLTNLDDLQRVESGFAKVEGIPLNVSTNASTDLDKNLDYRGVMFIRHNNDDLVCCYGYENALPILHGTHIAQFLKKAEEDKEKIIIGGRIRINRAFPSQSYLIIDVSYLESTC